MFVSAPDLYVSDDASISVANVQRRLRGEHLVYDGYRRKLRLRERVGVGNDFDQHNARWELSQLGEEAVYTMIADNKHQGL